MEFLPAELPQQIAWLRQYSAFPEVPRGLRIEEYMGVAQSFYRSAGEYLKPYMVPDADYLVRHLKLIPSAERPSHTPDEDLALVRYRAKGLDVLIAQTVDREFIFIKGTGLGPYKPAAGNRETLVQIIGTYLEPEEFGEFTVDKVLAGGVAIFDCRAKHPDVTPLDGQFICALAEECVCFVIPKVQPWTFVPAVGLPAADQWFESDKNRYSDRPLREFRYHEASGRSALPKGRDRQQQPGAPGQAGR